MRVFVSKRNRVYEDGGVVYKQHRSPEEAAAEASRLASLHDAGVRVPRVLSRTGPVICMAYLPGLTIPDYLAAQEPPCPIHEAARAVAAWLSDFYNAVDHAATGEHRGDVNGRNFILHGGCCWGVDFEERRLGSREQDAGRLLAFVETYDLADKHRQRQFYEELYDSLMQLPALDAALVERERRHERKAMQARRG